RHDRVFVSDGHVAGWADRVALGDGEDHFVRRHAIGLQPPWIDCNYQRPRAGAEWWRRRDARQAGKRWPHRIESQIINLVDTTRVTPQHEIADRNTAGIEPHDKGRDGPRRHEGP